MPRRRSFGPKRKSFGKGIKLNTKGGIPTSVSLGGKGLRVNVSSRGTRATTRNPLTGKSHTTSVGDGRRQSQASSLVQPTQDETRKKKGCISGCTPFLVLTIIAVVVILLLL